MWSNTVYDRVAWLSAGSRKATTGAWICFMPETKIDRYPQFAVNGIPAPSVSDILDLYFPPSNYYTEEGREDGHFRHEWYAFLAQGGVEEVSPYDKIKPAVDGFKKFLAEVKPVYKSGEIPYFHPTLRYCGTPDAVMEIGGRLSIVDYKPKAKQKRTMLQTALYYLLLRANGIMVLDRFEVRLYDGIYRMEKHDDPQDMRRAEIMVAAFQAAQFYK